MKNLAPDITRQRLLIEGFFTINVNEKIIIKFLKEITKSLKLRVYGKPSIHATGGKGKTINQGYDAFIPLIDSGIALYVWGNSKFFSIVVYTCKNFDNKKAVNFCNKFFKVDKIVSKSF